MSKMKTIKNGIKIKKIKKIFTFNKILLSFFTRKIKSIILFFYFKHHNFLSHVWHGIQQLESTDSLYATKLLLLTHTHTHVCETIEEMA